MIMAIRTLNKNKLNWLLLGEDSMKKVQGQNGTVLDSIKLTIKSKIIELNGNENMQSADEYYHRQWRVSNNHYLNFFKLIFFKECATILTNLFEIVQFRIINLVKYLCICTHGDQQNRVLKSQTFLICEHEKQSGCVGDSRVEESSHCHAVGASPTPCSPRPPAARNCFKANMPINQGHCRPSL